MNEKFLEKLIGKVKTIYTCYYEEAPSNAIFPYLVIPSITLSSLDSGYLSVFDIEIYNNELSNISVEKICDDLREELDGYSYYETGIGFHIGFDSQLIIKQNEQDLVIRRITFAARIFK